MQTEKLRDYVENQLGGGDSGLNGSKAKTEKERKGCKQTSTDRGNLHRQTQGEMEINTATHLLHGITGQQLHGRISRGGELPDQSEQALSSDIGAVWTLHTLHNQCRP